MWSLLLASLLTGCSSPADGPSSPQQPTTAKGPNADDDGTSVGAEPASDAGPSDAAASTAPEGTAAPRPHRIREATTPDPPEPLRCTDSPSDDDCYTYLPGGTFWMGAQSHDPDGPGYDPDALPNEGPVRQVTVAPFWMHRDEAVVTLFLRCLDAGWCQDDDVAQGGFSTFKGAGVQARSGEPLNSISWQGADRLCDFFGARLPTEAEWAFAARGVEGRRFPWGDAPACGAPSAAGFRPDGSRLPQRMQTGTCTQDGPRQARDLMGHTPEGIRGLAGNLWEWTADPYIDEAGPARSAPREGAGAPMRHVQRGGGWTSLDPLELRAAVRVGMAADRKVNDVGVRCVWNAPDTP